MEGRITKTVKTTLKKRIKLEASVYCTSRLIIKLQQSRLWGTCREEKNRSMEQKSEPRNRPTQMCPTGFFLYKGAGAVQ